MLNTLPTKSYCNRDRMDNGYQLFILVEDRSCLNLPIFDRQFIHAAKFGGVVGD